MKGCCTEDTALQRGYEAAVRKPMTSMAMPGIYDVYQSNTGYGDAVTSIDAVIGPVRSWKYVRTGRFEA